MGDKDFNLVKWAFMLAASCILVEVIIVVAGVVTCLEYADMIIAGKFVCDSKDKMTDLLDRATSAAMGFLAGVLAGKGNK